MSVKQEINLNSSMKKLLAAKFPFIKARNTVTNALSICAENFIELLVEATAEICNDNQKNLITPNNVLEALEKLGFPTLHSKAQEASQEITSNIKKQRESWKSLKMTEINLTEEEASRLQKELYMEAIRIKEDKMKKEKESSNTKNDS